jgi:hypothetical protein
MRVTAPDPMKDFAVGVSLTVGCGAVFAAGAYFIGPWLMLLGMAVLLAAYGFWPD